VKPEEPHPEIPLAPSGLVALERVSQGKPWAKLPWPVGPKSRILLTIGDDDSINVVKRDGQEGALCINVSADGVADAHRSNRFNSVCFPVARIDRERGKRDAL
jgi:hypothetical protein